MNTTSGWADNRLMEAYDLIYAVRMEYQIPDPEFGKLLSLIEDADDLLEQIFKERDEE